MTAESRIIALDVHPYRIPFRQPFATAHGTISAREGALVAIVMDNGAQGYGDMVALPEFGSPDLRLLVMAAHIVAPQIVGMTIFDLLATVNRVVEADGQPVSMSLPHPLLFALDTAIGALHMPGDPQYSMTLNGESRAVRPIAVNATIGAIDDAPDAARAALAAGYTCIKLKVGMLDDPAHEIARIRAVRAALGSATHLRLDANESWSFERALTILTACADLDLQYVEQPLARGNLAGMRTLRQQTHVPIAADEALTDLASVQAIVDADAADVLILKPQMLGGTVALRHALRSAHARGKQVTITTCIESGVGVAATLRIAQMMAAETSEQLLACGLATLPLLEDDLILNDLPIIAGKMQQPHPANIAIDWAAVDRYHCEVPGL